MPEPMPVVMDQVASIFSAWRRALPEIIIQVGWHPYPSSFAYSFTVVHIPPTGKINTADHTVFHFCHHISHVAKSSSLTSHLYEFLVLIRGFYQHFSFLRIVTARFFYVHVLPSL